MNKTKNILLLCGGGGREHEISLLSAKFIKEELAKIPSLKIFHIEITKDGKRINEQKEACELRRCGEIYFPTTDKTYKIDFAIPCLHGHPGESGEIPALFELMGLPYLGCNHESSVICFNKVTTKLYLDALGIPNTPYIFISELNDESIQRAKKALNNWGKVYIKASNQGSSIGTYCLENKDLQNLEITLKQALELSPYVLIEKAIMGRELEVACYEYEGKLIVTDPGEIICPQNQFYSYEQKYSKQTSCQTHVKAKNLSDKEVEIIKNFARITFSKLKLRHLSRIDFFITQNREILLNEINTFPGMTPISMFPQMMQANGKNFFQFIQNIINNSK